MIDYGLLRYELESHNYMYSYRCTETLNKRMVKRSYLNVPFIKSIELLKMKLFVLPFILLYTQNILLLYAR